MSIEYDSIIAAVTKLLGDYTGLSVCAYPFGKMRKYDAPVVAVTVDEAEASGSGAGDYLGIFTDPEKGEREVYGRFLEVTLGLYVYSPEGSEHGADALQRVFGQISAAFSENAMPLKVKSLQCGETEFDGVTRMYKCKVTAKCRCFMTAEIREDGEFSDYILKGVMIK